MVKLFLVKLFIGVYRIILFLFKLTLKTFGVLLELFFAPDKNSEPDFYPKRGGGITYNPNDKDRAS